MGSCASAGLPASTWGGTWTHPWLTERVGCIGQESQQELEPTSAPSDPEDLQQVTDEASLPSFRFYACSSCGQLTTRAILRMGFLGDKEVEVAWRELAYRVVMTGTTCFGAEILGERAGWERVGGEGSRKGGLRARSRYARGGPRLGDLNKYVSGR